MAMMIDMPKKRQPAKKLPPVSEQLKDAILHCGISRYRIAQDTGITEATLSKYVNGHHYLAQPTIDTLCEYLGLRLMSVDSAPVKKGR